MRKNTLIVSVLMIATFLAMFLFSANTHVTEANPPQGVWEAIPAKPPGNSRERIEIHPYPGMTVIYNPTDDDLNLPEEIRGLPICPESRPIQPTPPPSDDQLDEPARCRARIGGIAKFDSDFSPPPGFLPAGNPFSSSALPGQFAAQCHPNQYRFANHLLNCPSGICTTSSTGIDTVRGAITTQIPSLDSGASWDNYHYYNRLHVVHGAYPSSCYSGPETISAGIAYGQVQGLVFYNQPIFERIVQGFACNNLLGWLSESFDPPGAIMFRLYWDGSISKWRSEIWRGWGWQTVDSASARWSIAPQVDVGQEIASEANDFSKIHNPPVSFIHRILIDSPYSTLIPWNENVLPTELKGRTPAGCVDQPFRVMDAMAGDSTAISTYLP